MTRSDGTQLLVAEMHFLHGAGAEVLHHDIAGGDELARQLLGCGLLQVQAHTAVTGPARVVGDAAVGIAHAAGEGREHAGEVDAGPRLDLVDLGTEEAERLPDDRPGPHPTEVGDADASEWKGSFFFLSERGWRYSQGAGFETAPGRTGPPQPERSCY
jgi:hypothetical protein